MNGTPAVAAGRAAVWPEGTIERISRERVRGGMAEARVDLGPEARIEWTENVGRGARARLQWTGKTEVRQADQCEIEGSQDLLVREAGLLAMNSLAIFGFSITMVAGVSLRTAFETTTAGSVFSSLATMPGSAFPPNVPLGPLAGTTSFSTRFSAFECELSGRTPLGAWSPQTDLRWARFWNVGVTGETAFLVGVVTLTAGATEALTGERGRETSFVGEVGFTVWTREVDDAEGDASDGRFLLLGLRARSRVGY